jgi:Tfp pilus assembly protein PilZ
MGFTDDVTGEGMFIRSAVVHPVGTLIMINLTMPDNEKVVLEGTVQWSLRIPPIMLRQGKKGGMGIKISRFVSGVESYQMLCEILSSESKTCAH